MAERQPEKEKKVSTVEVTSDDPAKNPEDDKLLGKDRLQAMQDDESTKPFNVKEEDKDLV